MKPYILMFFFFCFCVTRVAAQIDSVGWNGNSNPMLLADISANSKTFLLKRADTLSRVSVQLKSDILIVPSMGTPFSTFVSPYLERNSVALINTNRLQLNNTQGTSGTLDMIDYKPIGPVLGPYLFFATDSTDTTHRNILVALPKRSLIRVDFIAMNPINSQRVITVPKIVLYKDGSSSPVMLIDGVTPALFGPGSTIFIVASYLKVGFWGGLTPGNPANQARFTLYGRYTVDMGWQ